MDNQIIIEVKNNYGNEVFYPVNDQAKRLATIAGTKTLSPATLSNAKVMGFEINIKSPAYTF